MEFHIYTDDGFKYRGTQSFDTLDDLMAFVNQQTVRHQIIITGNELFLMRRDEPSI